MAWELSGLADGRPWTLTWERPLIMGVLNVTPDSFSDGGRHADVDAAVAAAIELFGQGATIVDVGGESTRPGATPIATETECARVLPVIERLAAHLRGTSGASRGATPSALISVDTRHTEVAAAAIEAGARLVNDISGLRSPEMIAVCAATGTPAVVTHMLGEPATMQVDPRYDDVVTEVAAWIGERARAALQAGVPSVLVDPGIGFGKRLEHNLALLDAVGSLGPWPVLVGASRKRFIGEISGTADPTARDAGTIAAHLHAIGRGAAAVRAHDVAGHAQAFAVAAALRGT